MTLFPSLDPEQYSPLILAYIGDAVMELYFRMNLLENEKHEVRMVHRRVVETINAKNQCRILKLLTPHLSTEESEIIRKTRNKKMNSHPKSVTMVEYRHATALEALFGWHFMKQNFERLSELFELVRGFPIGEET